MHWLDGRLDGQLFGLLERLSARLLKNYWTDIHVTWMEDGLGPEYTPVTFSSDLYRGTDPGIRSCVFVNFSENNVDKNPAAGICEWVQQRTVGPWLRYTLYWVAVLLVLFSCYIIVFLILRWFEYVDRFYLLPEILE